VLVHQVGLPTHRPILASAAESAARLNALTSRHTDAVKTLSRARETNRLAAAIGFSVVWTVLGYVEGIRHVLSVPGSMKDE
jgi:hypothetical protein